MPPHQWSHPVRRSYGDAPSAGPVITSYSIHYTKLYDVEKDPGAAVKWFRLAAEQGLPGSQITLAMMYEQGNGVEEDLAEARKWYERAGIPSP